MSNVHIIPIKAFKDNYIWTIINEDDYTAWVVDPGDANPVIEFINANNCQLKGILITHHHYDHCDGVKTLLEKYSIPVYGPAHPSILATNIVYSGATIHLGACELSFRVLDIPGHTLEHVAYYCEQKKLIFCGDTLFSAGCGRVFEGTPSQMYHSLMKIATLPDDTKIYCTHEYTMENLLFAQQVEPDNSAIKAHINQVAKWRSDNTPSLPSLIALEKKINPFLRSQVTDVINMAEERAARKLENPAEVFAEIRAWKNNF